MKFKPRKVEPDKYQLKMMKSFRLVKKAISYTDEDGNKVTTTVKVKVYPGVGYAEHLLIPCNPRPTLGDIDEV